MDHSYHFLSPNKTKVLEELKKEGIEKALKTMLLIRQFDRRAEAAYQMGKIGGFFHTSTGQEAISVAASMALGMNNWYIATYRCHGITLSLGATPLELMAELYGKEEGNTHGRGGSMHFCLPNLLGGFGIVGGHIPIAAGAAFSAKYQNQKDKIAVCFLGEGAVAQGAFHESLNIASLWNLPLLVVIENNQWGMGTSVHDAISALPIAERQAPAYSISGYSVDGMDFIACYWAFKRIYEDIKKNQQPVLIEFVTSRFKGHSISDPALYRSKKELEREMQRDPIDILYGYGETKKWIDEKKFKQMEEEQRKIVKQAISDAEKMKDPDPSTLGDFVFASEDGIL